MRQLRVRGAFILTAVMITGSVAAFGRTIEVTITDLDAGTVSLAFGAAGEGDGDKALFAAWSPGDAGVSATDWRETAYIATIAAETTTFAYTIPETWRKRSGAIRFFLTPPRPYGKRLSFLRTVSAGPWINTGIVPGTNTDVSVKAYYPGDMAPFGVAGKISLFSNGLYYYGFFGASGSFSGDKSQPHTLRINATGAFLDGDCKAWFDPAVLTSSTSSTLTLFARRVDGASTVGKQGDCTLYAAQIATNGVPARDYVPCVKKDGTAALYDRVTGTFFTNAGSGTFTQGDEVDAKPVDCGEAESWSDALKLGRTITMTDNSPFLGTVTLALGNDERGGLLFAVGGASDAGTTVSGWQNMQFLAKVPAYTNTVTVSLPAAWWDDAAKVRFFWRSAEDFPYDRQVAFLESDGGPWINTGYIPGPGTEIFIRQRSAYDVAFGLSVHFYLFCNGDGTHYGYFGNNGSFNNYNPGLAVHDLTLGPTGAYLNGVLKASFTNTVYTSTMTKGISLFGRRDWQTGVIGKQGQCQIYSAQIRESGVTVRDFIPCVSNGVACLYDTVSRTFCFNAGASGAFVAGGTVTPATADSDALVWSDVSSLAPPDAIWDAGGGSDTSFAMAANWPDDTVPSLEDGNIAVSFATDGSEARLEGDAAVRGIRFHATNDFQLSAVNGAKCSIGVGGVMLKSSDTEALSTWRYYALAAPTEVATDQTWNLSSNALRRLQLLGDLSGASNRTLTVTGAGTLGFYATNSYTGSIIIESGVMKLFSKERIFGSADSGGVVTLDQTTGAQWNQFGAVIDKPVKITAADVPQDRFYTAPNYGTNWFTAPLTVVGQTFNWAINGETVVAGGASFAQAKTVRFCGRAPLFFRDKPFVAEVIEMNDAKELHLESASNRINTIRFDSGVTQPGNKVHCRAAFAFADYATSVVLDKSTTFHLHGYDQDLANLWINDAGSCVTSDAPAKLYVVQRGSAAVFRGSFQGFVDFAKSGGYTVTLACTNTSRGTLNVVNGPLEIAPEGCWSGTNMVVGATVSSIVPVLRLKGSRCFADPKNTVITMTTSQGGLKPQIYLDEGVDQTIAWLWLDGVLLGTGTWGSTTSAAAHKDDSHFAGTGVLTVRGAGGGTLIAVR